MNNIPSNMFIKKLELTSDISRVYDELTDILKITNWLPENQIGLNHRGNDNDIWKDATGSLYDRVNKIYKARESEFNIWNIDTNYYVRQQIELLQSLEKTSIGRVRFMRLLPKTGLSVHKDLEVRYHLVLKTNISSFIGRGIIAQDSISDVDTTSVCYHLPADSNWYRVDTTRAHYVYNAGDTERIHLVVCGV